MIRILYRFAVSPEHHDAFQRAYEAVVNAHVAAGHGALESMLLSDPETPDRLVAVSRWSSRAHWLAFQNDAVAPEAYAELRAHGTLIDKTVFEERVCLRVSH